ncbi:GNAT family N-acetyltransferase [Parabacteroides goldsteinii]|uniref:GNAT family N-acetyltransferase n=1 Tax=Parabacteroides goldsteinii TaxID=328812 RepID=UPI001CC8FC99|nr:GNAT family N-acetyltransferase [Parabacteroides goldsteinii]UBD75981.1 GNAT family N-acetyltransferase [Parabacteroides goldsteinii]
MVGVNERIDISQLHISRLEEGEMIKSFDCGDADLNDFILREAPFYQEALLTTTYVARVNNDILAYFSLANDRVSLGDFDSKTEFNRFRKHRFVNEKRLKSYPVVKICRFAVNHCYAGSGIGTILMDFIKVYFLQNNKTGCRFVTVDAYLAAISFYEKNHFYPLQPNDDDTHTRLLYFDLKEYKIAFQK